MRIPFHRRYLRMGRLCLPAVGWSHSFWKRSRNIPVFSSRTPAFMDKTPELALCLLPPAASASVKWSQGLIKRALCDITEGWFPYRHTWHSKDGASRSFFWWLLESHHLFPPTWNIHKRMIDTPKSLPIPCAFISGGLQRRCNSHFR